MEPWAVTSAPQQSVPCTLAVSYAALRGSRLRRNPVSAWVCSFAGPEIISIKWHSCTNASLLPGLFVKQVDPTPSCPWTLRPSLRPLLQESQLLITLGAEHSVLFPPGNWQNQKLCRKSASGLCLLAGSQLQLCLALFWGQGWGEGAAGILFKQLREACSGQGKSWRI